MAIVSTINSSQNIGDSLPTLQTNFDDLESYTPENVVVVKTASQLAGTLDSTKVYLIDGSIDMGTTQIVVPATGLDIRGVTRNSKLYSTEASYTMFVDSTVAGTLTLERLFLSVNGTSSKLFDLDNNQTSGQVVMSLVTLDDVTEIGSFSNYTQMLITNVSFFNIDQGLEFVGTWASGCVIDRVLVRNSGASSTMFRAGTGLTFAGRFLSNINMDTPSGAVGYDFVAANFTNDKSYLLEGGYYTGAGTVSSNLDRTSVKSFFADNTGLESTIVGGLCKWTTSSATTISVVDTPVKVAGTTTYYSEAWFSHTTDNQMVYDSTNTSYITIFGVLNFSSGANKNITFIVRQWDNSASSYIDLGSFGPMTADGSGNGINVAIMAFASIDTDDYIELWVENNTDTTSVTVDVGSVISVVKSA